MIAPWRPAMPLAAQPQSLTRNGSGTYLDKEATPVQDLMKLRMRRFPIRSIVFGSRTDLNGETLSVNREELIQLILVDLHNRIIDMSGPTNLSAW